jgi:hypothetical protein
MHHTLKPHPDTPSRAVSRISVAVARPHARKLELTYLVTGEIGELLLPAAALATRADELWKHTCFEAFVREDSAPSYREFNFSPSSQWAAYAFAGYRQGMTNADIATPVIETSAAHGTLMLKAAFEPNLPAGAVQASHRLALSAVIEETDGRKSYWALAHPPGTPDFHHPDCFTLELPRA